MEIVTFTPNPCLDETVWLDGDGRELERTWQTGGKGLNVARVLAALGDPVTALAPLGGEAGRRVEELARAEGFSLSPLPCNGETRTVTTWVRRDTWEQRQKFGEGPPLSVPRCVEAVEARLKCCSLLVLCGRLPEGSLMGDRAILELYPALIRRAREAGVPVWLDSHGAGFPQAVSAGPDLLKPNLEEALELAEGLGEPPAPEGGHPALVQAGLTPGQAAHLSPLLHRFSGRLLITLGERGVLQWARGEGRYFPPCPVNAVNPVGSGDSFVAGWIHGWLRGLGDDLSLRVAQAAGAANASMWPAAQLTPGDLLAADPGLREWLACGLSP